MWRVTSPTLEGTLSVTRYIDLSEAIKHLYGPRTMEVAQRVIATLAQGYAVTAGACGKVYTLSKATEQDYYS